MRPIRGRYGVWQGILASSRREPANYSAMALGGLTPTARQNPHLDASQVLLHIERGSNSFNPQPQARHNKRQPCLACGCGLNDRGRFQTLFNVAQY